MASSSSQFCPCYPRIVTCPSCLDRVAGAGAACSVSGSGVDAGSGQVRLSSTDLSWSGLGFSWDNTRSYANLVHCECSNFLQGANWFNSGLPYLTNAQTGGSGEDSPDVGMITGAASSVWFGGEGSEGREALFGSLDEIRNDTVNSQMVVTDNEGNRNVFHSFDSSIPQSLRGRLKATRNPMGAKGEVTYNLDNEVTSLEWTDETGKSAAVHYEYEDALSLLGLIKSVTLEVDGVPVQRARYRHAEFSDSIATAGDLQLAVVEEWNGTGWSLVTEEACRYYVEGDVGGFEHGLKMVFDPESVVEIRRAGLDPLTSPESRVAPYADRWYAYDSERRVVEARTDGGSQVYLYDWMQASPEPEYSDVNTWAMRCVERLPDGDTNTTYTNRSGRELVRIHRAVAIGWQWVDYFQLNADCRVTLEASPSAVQSISEPASPGDALIVGLFPSTGMVRTYQYYDEDDLPNGHVKGWVKAEYVRQGEFGTPVLVREYTFETQAVGSVDIHQPWKTWSYPVAGVPQSEAALTVSERTYFEDDLGNPTFQVQQLTATPPVIDSDQHGTGQPEPSTEIYDEQGRVIWERNARGFITRNVYDAATGAITRHTQDVDTSQADGVPAGWVTPAGGGLNLVTDYENDSRGRNLRTIAPWIDVDPATVGAKGDVPLRVRPVSYICYRDAAHQVWGASGYMKDAAEGASWHILGPVSVTLMDASGRTTDGIQAPPACACGPLGPDTFNGAGILPLQSLWTRWTHSVLDLMGRVVESRVYHTIPDSGEGFAGTNYDATFYSYDDMGRQFRTVSPGGTITSTVFDSRGLTIERWVGTNDNGATPSDPSGGGAAGNNMRRVWLGVYDNGAPGGDGNVTQQTLPVDDNPSNDRIALYAYDERNRLSQTTTNDGTRDYFDVSGYDNLDRVIGQTRYHTSVTEANRTHYATTAYDDRGRTYEQKRYSVESDGSLGNALVAGTWYDPNGNVNKQTQQGALVVGKTVYDSVDRPETQYQVSEDPSTAGTNTNSVALDTVIQQSENLYNDAGHLLAVTGRARFDDATGTGPLQGPTGSQPQARVSYGASYADPIGRLRFAASYGTNGALPWSYPAIHAEPSELILVTEQRYAPDGDAFGSVDPEGVVTVQERDNAGRRIRVVENADGAEGTRRTSSFQYAPDGGMLRLILENPATGQQVTNWQYGTTLADSAIARSDLPVRKTYPTGESDTYTYNRQSETATMTDANGSVQSYNRDKLGRLVDNALPVVASGVDAVLRRVSTAYDERGRVQYVTTADDPNPGAGTVLTQVLNEYNGIDCLITQAQNHAGAVDGSTPRVQYTCTAAADNIQRRTAIIYPDGRTIAYEYGTGGSIDDVLNRIQSLHEDATLTTIAEFLYLGAAMPAVTTLPPPNLQRRWKSLPGEPPGDAGDPYTGYDRFGRTERMRWFKQSDGTHNPLVDVTWGYSPSSQKTWRKDLLAPATTQQDQKFNYDALYQITQRQRGLLNINATATGGIPAQQENFTYDETGNWKGYQRQASGATEIDQTRVNNRSNQITQVDGSSAGISYDRNGNMLTVPTGDALTNPSNHIVWDGWNRPVKVYDAADNLIAEYRYDGLGRRITVTSGGTTRHTYYDDQWRSIEERLDASTTPERQHIWHPADRWEMILRNSFFHGPNEQHYPLKDQLDPVALADESGTVVERYSYTAFGVPTFMDSEYNPRSYSHSSWNFLFHAEFQDVNTGWFNYGYRYYVPQMGRWPSRDPVGEGGGLSLYSMVGNNPIAKVDLFGLSDLGNTAQSPMPVPTPEQMAAAMDWMPEMKIPSMVVVIIDTIIDNISRLNLRKRWAAYYTCQLSCSPDSDAQCYYTCDYKCIAPSGYNGQVAPATLEWAVYDPWVDKVRANGECKDTVDCIIFYEGRDDASMISPGCCT